MQRKIIPPFPGSPVNLFNKLYVGVRQRRESVTQRAGQDSRTVSREFKFQGIHTHPMCEKMSAKNALK